MRIKKVDIENFQSHKNTTIEPEEYFTILAGSSNSGKSSFLRAINWCLRNTPSGNSYIRIGQKSAKVRVTFDDGYAVERERGKGSSLNYYRLFKDGELLEEYTGFGTGVPQRIEEVAGDGNSWEYTFADQLESPYLIGDSPRVRAEKIGNLEDFAKLDGVITKIKEEERDIKRTERETQKELIDVLSSIQSVESEIEFVEPLYKQLERVYNDVTEKSQKVRLLEGLFERLKEIEEEVPTLESKVSSSELVVQQFEGLYEKNEKFNKLRNVLNRLRDVKTELEKIHIRSDEIMDGLVDDIKMIDDSIEKFKEINRIRSRFQNNSENLDNVPKYSEVVASIDLEPISVAINKYKKAAVLKNGIYENEVSRTELKKRVDSTYTQIEKLLNQFVEEIKSNEMCPTCTQDTSKIEIETIKNNL